MSELPIHQFADVTRSEIHHLYQMNYLASANRPAKAIILVVCLMFLALTLGVISTAAFDITLMIACLCASIWLVKLRGTLNRLADAQPPARAHQD